MFVILSSRSSSLLNFARKFRPMAAGRKKKLHAQSQKISTFSKKNNSLRETYYIIAYYYIANRTRVDVHSMENTFPFVCLLYLTSPWPINSDESVLRILRVELGSSSIFIKSTYTRSQRLCYFIVLLSLIINIKYRSLSLFTPL